MSIIKRSDFSECFHFPSFQEISCIFGGAFDPVHTGHLHLAAEISKEFSISRFIWVPTFSPPHKPQPGTPYHHRVNMVKLAISKLRGHIVSEVESKLPLPSYALATIRTLKKEFASTQKWYFIIGADNWTIFQTWHKWEEILSEIEILIYPRKDYKVEKLFQNATLLDFPAMDITSSGIRSKLRAGKLPSDTELTAPVRNYIHMNSLY